MKSFNKQLSSPPATIESSVLRMVYKNEEDIINEILSTPPEKETAILKVSDKLFLKESLPMFDDYRFKAKEHDPL